MAPAAGTQAPAAGQHFSSAADKSSACRGAEPLTTNNRMELMAAIEALAALEGPCRARLTTDSQYVRQGITRWMNRWKANGWLTTGRQPVKNRDLWSASTNSQRATTSSGSG